jgi:4-amino-4-deoxy-L-arabinose transferase-like glycosyltransferase
MSEGDVGKALLRGEDPINIQALTDRVLRRDRWRIRLLGIACFIAWMLVVMLPWATIMPMLAKVGQYQFDASQQAAPSTADQWEQFARLAEVVKEGTMATFFGSLASMFVAAICTVSLVIYSRRATLRQVNARLGEISAQLKMLPRPAK